VQFLKKKTEKKTSNILLRTFQVVLTAESNDIQLHLYRRLMGWRDRVVGRVHLAILTL